jgi:hypothetical protein
MYDFIFLNILLLVVLIITPLTTCFKKKLPSATYTSTYLFIQPNDLTIKTPALYTSYLITIVLILTLLADQAKKY